MFAALAFALQASQANASPTLPVGASAEFAAAVRAVEARLVDGDLAGAREAARALPVRTPHIAWDDTGLPAGLRAVREPVLKSAAFYWSRVAKDFAPTEAGGAPDVTIGFAPVLPDGSEGLPLPATVAFGAPFRGTIGLTRGKPGIPLRTEELNQQVAFVLGRYLGVPELPVGFNGSAMRPDPRPNLRTFPPNAPEWRIAAQNLDFADRLRAAVAAGKPLGLAYPVARLAKTTLDLGDIEQGKPLRGAIEIENLGSGPLSYTVTRDCGCFSFIPPGTVPPQGRARIPITINTQEYYTRIDKALLLDSNDPDHPRIEVPVTFRVRPAYRLFRPGGDRVALPPQGGTYDYFLITPPGSPIHPLSVAWNGFQAKVAWEPWSGPLADPEVGEGALPRTGWRFHVTVPKGLDAGRTNGSLTIETDSILFRTLTATLYVQKGIVADDVNLGDVLPGAKASFIVDRPNAPFKITGVDAGPLKAVAVPRRGGWEYRIDLEYPGGAPKGDLLVPVRIHTDDPKQPVVEATARGFVK